MSTSRPIISIGMPVYNGARFLEQAIDSILAQTADDIELIISDNCSTDATPALCAAYCRHDKRVRYIRNERNLGAAANYNQAFHCSRGEYFKWAAADDVVAPTMLERCLASLIDNPDSILAYPKTIIINSSGACMRPYDDRLHVEGVRPSERFRTLVRRVRECNAVFGLIRRSTLAKTGLIGAFLSSDVCLLAELSLYGGFYEIPEPLFFRREHSAASSCYRSRDEQLSFFSPRLTGRPPWLQWRLLLAHYQNALRADIPASEKLRCLLFLASRFRKNRDVYFSELASSLRYGKSMVHTPVKTLKNQIPTSSGSAR